jgi:hypothetical protein
VDLEAAGACLQQKREESVGGEVTRGEERERGTESAPYFLNHFGY